MRKICILSGMICAGKSACSKKLKEMPEFHDACFVGLDEIGLRYWGRRVMTRTEKVYRNQLMREEVQRRIIVDDARLVLLDMLMLTRKNHQEPFVRMVEETRSYLEAIDAERAGLAGRPAPDACGEISLKVVLLYCYPDRILDRLERRKREEDNKSPVLSMEGMLDAAVQFEMPEAYQPLPVDTTDESEEAERERIREITAFLLRGEMPPGEKILARMKEAQDYLDLLKLDGKKAGITAGAAFLKSDYQK